MKTLISHSEQETKELASGIASELKDKPCLCLYGEIGSGKTIFSKGLAKALGIEEKSIKSPTFTLFRSYQIGRKTLYHFDFYRMNEADDLMAHQLEEIFNKKDAVIVIEWPERIKTLLPAHRYEIHFEYHGPTERLIRMEKL